MPRIAVAEIYCELVLAGCSCKASVCMGPFKKFSSARLPENLGAEASFLSVKVFRVFISPLSFSLFPENCKIRIWSLCLGIIQGLPNLSQVCSRIILFLVHLLCLPGPDFGVISACCSRVLWAGITLWLASVRRPMSSAEVVQCGSWGTDSTRGHPEMISDWESGAVGCPGSHRGLLQTGGLCLREVGRGPLAGLCSQDLCRQVRRGGSGQVGEERAVQYTARRLLPYVPLLPASVSQYLYHHHQRWFLLLYPTWNYPSLMQIDPADFC